MSNILVVDDDAAVRFTVRDFLESAGHSVVEACNGKECLAILEKVGSFDCVVTDIIMPEKDGVETTLHLKRIYPDLKVIVISGGGRSNNMELLDAAKVLGADAVLAKPFTQGQLLETLQSCRVG
jgi:CheY-like chemotaxis protein